MPYRNTWTRIEELDGGGQSRTYLVTDQPLNRIDPQRFASIFDSASKINPEGKSLTPKQRERFNRVAADFLDWIGTDRRPSPSRLAVEKELHPPKSRESHQKILERFDIEVETLQSLSHPNIVKLIDHDREHLSLVTEFCRGGTLDQQPNYFGSPLDSLLAYRPLVEAVSEIHKLGYTHRDIKPQNIFVKKNGELVLGDFGLVFDSGRSQPRVTSSGEKIGSTDYMPPWVRREYMDEVPLSFDVYALGKVLYEMVSGKKLHLWYRAEPEFHLPSLFPRSEPEMHIIDELLSEVVCEQEEGCLPDALALLEKLDSAIEVLSKNGQIVAPDVKRRCLVCAKGVYEVVEKEVFDEKVFGAATSHFSCDACGHVQFFLL